MNSPFTHCIKCNSTWGYGVSEFNPCPKCKGELMNLADWYDEYCGEEE